MFTFQKQIISSHIRHSEAVFNSQWLLILSILQFLKKNSFIYFILRGWFTLPVCFLDYVLHL